MIVTDVSTLIELLLQTQAAAAVSARCLRAGETMHAPALVDIEVAQVLRRFATRGGISSQRGRVALALLGAFPLVRYGHEPLLGRIWELRDNLTAYDAAYVALAEALRAPLVTLTPGSPRHPASARRSS